MRSPRASTVVLRRVRVMPQVCHRHRVEWERRCCCDVRREPSCAAGYSFRSMWRRLIGTGATSVLVAALFAATAGAIIGVGGPTEIPVKPPSSVVRQGGTRLAEFEAGRKATAQSGCLACHRIGAAGNRGPGANLSHVGARLSRREIERALVRSRPPMPSFANLPKRRSRAIVTFLMLLR
jgi:menaquinol-cytochrome c reductase cytochrome b/c subunit